MIEMQVDGRTIEAKEGETILSALKREGIHVPTLCHMEGLLPSGACRMCVVEMEGAPNFVPACSYPGGRGDEDPDPLAEGAGRAPDDRRTAAEQPPGRLPLLRAERQVRSAAAVADAWASGSACTAARRNDAGKGRLRPHRPRPGEVHPLRPLRARLRGDPGRRRPSISSAAAARPSSARPSTRA